MPTKEPLTTTRTRLLLIIWNIGGGEIGVKKSLINARVKRKHEKIGDYEEAFKDLRERDAITLSSEKRSGLVYLTSKGLQMLDEGLRNTEFQFGGSQIGSRVGNALLKWIRNSNGRVSSTLTTDQIQSYEQFKQLALDVYHRLNRDHNYDRLVPIYHLRREIGEKVTRSQFNDWLLEMQAHDILQLMEGSLPDEDPSKIEDSMTTELSGLRCYVKLLLP